MAFDFNPFKKQTVNGYETYAPDSPLKIFLKAFNPFLYNSTSDNNNFWRVFKGFLFSVLIASLIFILLFSIKVNSLNFSNTMGHFDNFSIEINQKMNSPIIFPMNKPFIFINTTKLENKTTNRTNKTTLNLDNYSMELFNDTSIIDETKQKTNKTISNIKSKTKQAKTFLFIDNEKIILNSLFKKKIIYFDDYNNPKEDAKHYENLFKILYFAILPSLFLIFYLFLTIKFIVVGILFFIFSFVIFLFTKQHIKPKKSIKFVFLSLIPSLLVQSIVFVYLFNTFWFYFLPCLTFLIYYGIALLKFSYKEKDFVFN